MIRFGIGIKMESRIWIGANIMPIHNTDGGWPVIADAYHHPDPHFTGTSWKGKTTLSETLGVDTVPPHLLMCGCAVEVTERKRTWEYKNQDKGATNSDLSATNDEDLPLSRKFSFFYYCYRYRVRLRYKAVFRIREAQVRGMDPDPDPFFIMQTK